MPVIVEVNLVHKKTSMQGTEFAVVAGRFKDVFLYSLEHTHGL